jgi:photosystem II stability/assembly factor-like uncharacterized protein
MRLLAILLSVTLAFNSVRAEEEKGKWISISDGVIAKLTEQKIKIGYPGLAAGITVDPASGDVYMVICDNGIWKSSDKGATFERADTKQIGGRCETGFALDFDPTGKRLMCYMIYGSSALTLDSGKTWQASKLSHLDFGSTDWSDPAAKNMLSLKHESGGDLVVSHDAGATWKSLGKGFKQLGLFDGGVLMASKGDGILRSTDDGQTWTKVSELKPTGYCMRVNGVNGYWVSDVGVLVSKDKGVTWTVLGTPIKALLGPYFGKDAANMIVANKEGLHETTDSGATWKLVTASPTGFPAGPVGPNYGWDPNANILYASSMGKPAYKFVR